MRTWVVATALGFEAQIPLRLIQTAPAHDREEGRRYAADLIALNPEMEYQMFNDERALAFASFSVTNCRKSEICCF